MGTVAAYGGFDPGWLVSTGKEAAETEYGHLSPGNAEITEKPRAIPRCTHQKLQRITLLILLLFFLLSNCGFCGPEYCWSCLEVEIQETCLFELKYRHRSVAFLSILGIKGPNLLKKDYSSNLFSLYKQPESREQSLLGLTLYSMTGLCSWQTRRQQDDAFALITLCLARVSRLEEVHEEEGKSKLRTTNETKKMPQTRTIRMIKLSSTLCTVYFPLVYSAFSSFL